MRDACRRRKLFALELAWPPLAVPLLVGRAEAVPYRHRQVQILGKIARQPLGAVQHFIRQL